MWRCLIALSISSSWSTSTSSYTSAPSSRRRRRGGSSLRFAALFAAVFACAAADTPPSATAKASGWSWSAAGGWRPISAADDSPPLQLPNDANANPHHDPALKPIGEAARTVTVGGAPVLVDSLGPIVLNKDGSFSRISNWLQMADGEQARTLKLVAKRNLKRRKKLEASGGSPIGAGRGWPGFGSKKESAHKQEGS